ncbi:leucyl aminopeptidase family protein [Candidatus Kaiserbacteria bacterium]|nr:leucyl aminopeptidase family protein [Candidatus Kaiserbacteria bacterium]
MTKITPISNSKTLPKDCVRIAWHEGEESKYIEQQDGSTTLSIAAGKYKDVNVRTFRTLCRAIVRTAKTHKIDRLVVEIEHPFPQLETHDATWIVGTMAENFLLANYTYTAYKKDKHDIKEILISGVQSAEAKKALDRAVVIATEVNKCRDLANTPGSIMTPSLLAEHAKQMVKGTGARVTVFDKKRIEKERMGALLGVGRGAKHGPRFIILEYYGASKKEAPIVFVGKGITFDSGGLNVKVGGAMLDMHLDMSGGAAVIGAVVLAAKLKLKKNIIGLVPATENAISDDSLHPGDVLVGRSGKTIDVLDTDAEGRLVLSDALTYAQIYSPRLVVDVATLTGASLVALGEHCSALMTKDDAVRETFMKLGEESGDYLWPLPLWDEYKQYIKGRFGDVANIPASGYKWGGAINGGMFLSHFAEGYPDGCKWAHIDMAPRMTSVASDKLAKGATGEPIRLLTLIAERY